MAGRGRPKGSTNQVTNQSISEQDVYDLFTFAAQQAKLPYFANVFTPDLVNSRFKDITMNPLEATGQKVEEALKNPKENEDLLIGFSEFFEYTDMVYKRLLHYMGGMLSFDINYTCTNIKKPEEYKSLAYKKDLAIVYDFLDKFNCKEEFQRVLKQTLRQETYFGSFRDDGEKYVFQELPEKYCKITGKSDYGFVYDFNMYYFLEPGVDLNMYSDSFKRFYSRMFQGKLNYNPSASLDKRTGNWVYWVQTSITKDNMWAFKFNDAQAGRVPFFAPLYSDLVLKPLVRKLQTSKYIIEASKVLVGLIGVNKDNKSGNVANSFNISPDIIGKFSQLFRAGLAKEIQFTTGPFSDVKSFDFQASDLNMLADYEKTTSSMSGVNTRLLYATDKMNADETRNSISVDEYLMTALYPMFNKFMDFQINRLTKNYKFKFWFEGTEFDLNRTNRLQNATDLAQIGIVLPQKFSSALGMLPQDFERMLDEAKSRGFTDKLMPMLNMFNQSSKGGRPQKSDKELSDSGMITRDAGSNISKGGQI